MRNYSIRRRQSWTYPLTLRCSWTCSCTCAWTWPVLQRWYRRHGITMQRRRRSESRNETLALSDVGPILLPWFQKLSLVCFWSVCRRSMEQIFTPLFRFSCRIAPPPSDPVVARRQPAAPRQLRHVVRPVAAMSPTLRHSPILFAHSVEWMRRPRWLPPSSRLCTPI